MKTTDGVFESAHSKVEKFDGDIVWEERDGILVPLSADATMRGQVVEPFEVVDKDHNLLVIGGASALWQRLIGTAITVFDNANAYLSVGDSATAAVDTHTELQAVTNRFRRPMDATYPLHTDTTGTVGSKSILYRSTYATTEANWVWNEWGLFNAVGTGGPPVTGGRMLNRVVAALGTKTSAATWVLTVTLTLA